MTHFSVEILELCVCAVGVIARTTNFLAPAGILFAALMQLVRLIFNCPKGHTEPPPLADLRRVVAAVTMAL